MEGRRRSGTESLEEDRLEILNNRLLSSTYEEDRAETLENIYACALRMPVAAGTICLRTVFQSLREAESPALQLRIIESVIASGHRNEFTEMLFEEQLNIDILCKLSIDVFARLSNIFRSKYYFAKVCSHEGCVALVASLVEADQPECAGHFIAENAALKDRLVFEGILEILIGKLSGTKGGLKHRRAFESLLGLFVKDSLVCQNYMIETGLYASPIFGGCSSDRWVLSILSQLLNPSNSRFRDIQDKLFVARQIHRAVEQKNYGFLYKLALGHPAKMQNLLRRYLDRDIMIEDAEKSMDAFQLFCSYVEFANPAGISSESYRINIVLEEHGMARPLHHKVLGELEAGAVSRDLILYVIFVFDSLDSVEGHLRAAQMDELCDGLRMVLFLMHSRMSVSEDGHYQAVERLKSLRRLLCSTTLINEHFDGALISTITELIEELSESHKAAIKSAVWPEPASASSRTMDASVDVCLQEPSIDDSIEKTSGHSPAASTTTFSQRFHRIIGEQGYKKIADTFKIFKKSSTESDVYDL